jgi:hypothetical protein
MSKKLGQLLAKFNKEVIGAVNQNIKDLNNINNLIKQAGPKFVEYLDDNWEVNTDADRKAKAEALEQIKGDMPLSGSITSFKEGFDEEMSDGQEKSTEAIVDEPIESDDIKKNNANEPIGVAET